MEIMSPRRRTLSCPCGVGQSRSLDFSLVIRMLHYVVALCFCRISGKRKLKTLSDGSFFDGDGLAECDYSIFESVSLSTRLSLSAKKFLGPMYFSQSARL